jgi:hypothetical protein
MLMILGLFFYGMFFGSFSFYLLGIKGVIIGFFQVFILVLIWYLFYGYEKEKLK